MNISEIQAADFPNDIPENTALVVFCSQHDEGLLQKAFEKSSEHPIAILAENKELYDGLLKEREKYPALFLLQKGYHKQLFETLATHFQEAQDGAVPKQLLREYIATIFDKVYLLLSLIDSYTQASEPCLAIKKMVHKFASSAGSYGFTNALTYIRGLENSLDENNPPPKEYFEQFIKDLYPSFSLHTQETDPHPERKQAAPEQAQQPPTVSDTQTPPQEAAPLQQQEKSIDLILIDDDQDLTKQIEAICNEYGFSTCIYNDFKKAHEEVLSKKARLVLVDIQSGQEIDGYSIMQLYKDNPDIKASILTGFLTGNVSLEDKLKSLEFDIDFYIEKPINTDLLLHHLYALKDSKAPEKLRALLIDDDQDFSKQLIEGAKQYSYEVYTIADPKETFNRILEVNPHMILIDYQLEPIKGTDLLALIRDDARMRNIPIMMISGNQSEEMYKSAINQGVAGFIPKPITAQLLKERINAYFQKEVFLQYLEKTNPIYGYYTSAEMTHIFNTIAPLSRFITVVTFELKAKQEVDIATWMSQTKTFVKWLRETFGTKLPFGQWEPNQLILFSSNYTIPRMQLLLDEHFRSHPTDELEYRIGFSQFPTDGKTIDELVQKCKEHASETLKLDEHSFEKTIFHEPKKAVVISHDASLLSVIGYTLKQWNIDTHGYDEPDKAIVELRGQLFKAEPDVILLDFDLPYHNGTLLLERLGNLLGDRIPIVILATTQNERGVTDALMRGAFTYIAKPFNVQHLTTITLQAITG